MAHVPLPEGLDLRAALRACARLGHARVPAGVAAGFLRDLRRELDAGPFRPFGESFGSVRQQIDGFDVPLPSDDFPLLTELCRELRDRVRRHGRGLRGLATWAPNEVGIAHYVPGSIGITPTWTGSGTGGWSSLPPSPVERRSRSAVLGTPTTWWSVGSPGPETSC